tara:strand:- start:57 stop:497 length:441 start_codon:yes stop_codon:yes gene_type:complete
MRIDVAGSLLVGTSTSITNTKLRVSGGAANLSGVITYSKNVAAVNTTGTIVAGIKAATNGDSALLTMTGIGGTGDHFHIVFSCRNQGGTWVVDKNVISSAGTLDVEASANASTITFTFKTTSGIAYYTPKVIIQGVGTAINEQYFI